MPDPVQDPVFDTLAAVLVRSFHCDPAIVTPETVSSDIAGWDSLSHVYLIMNIEQEFGLRLPLDEIVDCADVGAMAAVTRRALARLDRVSA
jgi:acyl carrier protein